MAWTIPKTWVANDVLTAAELNEQLRDNLLEQLPAVCSGEGSWFSVEQENTLVERVIVSDTVLQADQTASTSFVDLNTYGPEVTVETGSTALVLFSANLYNNSTSAQAVMSYAISGDTSRSATDEVGIFIDGLGVSKAAWGAGMWDLVEDLTPGTNTFTAKYRAGGAGTMCAFGRTITVWPL